MEANDTAAIHRRAADGVDLTGLTAVVTGGASGIGHACATRLAQAGAAGRLDVGPVVGVRVVGAQPG